IRDAPESDSVVFCATCRAGAIFLTDGGQPAAVWAERDTAVSPAVAFEGQDLSATGDVPHDHPIDVTHRGQPAPVRGAKSHTVAHVDNFPMSTWATVWLLAP